MSLRFFPVIYDDELVYSFLARTYEYSGFLTLRDFLEEVFEDRNAKPDKEFINLMRKDVSEKLNALTNDQLIEKHTMFPLYSKFLTKERVEEGLELIKSTKPFFRDHLYHTQTLKDRFMRYCPECVREDRWKYGTAYWHRLHQMPYLNYCCKHKCRLAESSVNMGGKASPNLVSLESVVYDGMGSTVYDGNEQYLDYFYKILSDGKYYSDIYRVIDRSIRNSKYASSRGRKRHVTALFEDYKMAFPDSALNGPWVISKIVAGNYRETMGVLELCCFLKIEDFNSLPKSQNSTDLETIQMVQSGISMNETARRLNVSSATVRKICRDNGIKSAFTLKGRKLEERIESARGLWLRAAKEHPDISYTKLLSLSPVLRKEMLFLRREDREWTDKYFPKYRAKSGKRARDWGEFDNELLGKVEEVIRTLENKPGRPVRITIDRIVKILGLKCKLNVLPRCMKLVKEHSLSVEEYWAREVTWAIGEVVSREEPLNWKHVRTLTNMRRKDLSRCLPFLDEETCRIASGL